MRLLRIPKPFDHPDFLYEVKVRRLPRAGARHRPSTASSSRGRAISSRAGPYLAEEIAHAVRAHSTVLDGEIVCLDANVVAAFTICCSVASGRTFDVLSIDKEDLRALPFVERKRRLARIMPRAESRLLLLDAIPARGERLFELACERDLEGMVAKWARGTYQSDGRGTS